MSEGKRSLRDAWKESTTWDSSDRHLMISLAMVVPTIMALVALGVGAAYLLINWTHHDLVNVLHQNDIMIVVVMVILLLVILTPFIALAFILSNFIMNVRED